MKQFDSRTWTGRSNRTVPMWLYSLCWPPYDCELCVGQEYWRGCYCAYHDAVAPCQEPEPWRMYLRAAVQFLFQPDGPN